MKSLLNSNAFSLFVLTAFTFALIYFTNRNILTPTFYENSGHPMSRVPLEEVGIYASLQRWIYLTAILYLIVKLCAISLVLYTALYLSDQTVAFEKVFQVVVLSDYTFLIPAGLKLLFFHRFYPAGNLDDWHKFYILSVLPLFPSVPADYYFALQSVNVFEVTYWFVLAYGIYKITNLNYDRSLRLVVFSYLPAFFIWVCVVTFCVLMIFPATA